MGHIWRNLKSFSGGLLMLCIMLIALFWILNFFATRTPAPISTFAGEVESRASGQAYA